MSLTDAVKALKLVKADLDKHKSLLQSKSLECEALQSSLLQATTAASLAASASPPPPPPYPGAGGNSAATGGQTLGLEYEDSPPRRSGNDAETILSAGLRDTVKGLEQQLAAAREFNARLKSSVEGEMEVLRNRAAASDALKREKEGMAMEIEVLGQSVKDMEAAAANAVSTAQTPRDGNAK